LANLSLFNHIVKSIAANPAAANTTDHGRSTAPRVIAAAGFATEITNRAALESDARKLVILSILCFVV